MKIISHAKLTKGYEHWKLAFDKNESLRQEYGFNVLAYGHLKIIKMKFIQFFRLNLWSECKKCSIYLQW